MSINLDIFRVSRIMASAILNEIGSRPFVVLSFRRIQGTESEGVTLFLPASALAWAEKVAEAMNQPIPQVSVQAPALAGAE